MQKKWVVSALATGCVLLASCSNTAPMSQQTPPAQAFAATPAGTVKVSRVIDGDTFELPNKVKVRVLGIDSCESSTPGGKRAEVETVRLILNRNVQLRVQPKVDLDRYGRELRYVTLDDGQDLGEVLVKADHTYVYPKKNDASSEYVDKLRSIDKNGRNCNI